MNQEDKKIQALMDKVAEQKAKIERTKRPEYQTNLQFSWDESTRNTLNLNTVNDIKIFVQILAFLTSYKERFDNACKRLGVSIEFTHGGYSLEDWEHDIKAKVSNLNIANEKRKLKRLEKQLNALLSPKMKRKLEIEAIAEELE